MNKKGLKLEQVLEKVLPRLKKLDKLNDLEYYAVFMGKVQIVEWLMKRLLTDEQGYDYETIERMNLGKTIGVKEKIKSEVERFKKFQQSVLGIKTKVEVADLDIRNYAKYLLREGADIEKRELLSCTKSKILLSNKIIALSH